ncbi:hypothetical protein [Halorussus sp. MSC15.2]|uniref:hypothetical protein n=1 Tax=Halorussus sp. MSC15.2 TaxID=2283638 RepID=UPI0013D4C849|nr:hypothetical protein [Halorussus sp. MSC15.2]NEU57349.1 hypothetical protein [Halorussus sp. MSC15.2]
MELTWLVASSILLVSVGYGFLRRARRTRVVCWTRLGASLFALATRDLFQSRERGRPAASPVGESATRAERTRTERAQTDDERRTPLFVRLRRRVAGWLN